MNSDVAKTLESEIEELAVSFENVVEWQWDGRFKTPLAEFPIDRKGEILELLEKHLVSRWDASSVVEAPEVVREILKTLGGLMSGQLLLLSNLEGPAFLFCAWWPWGNGQKVSIRIGAFGEASEKEALTQVLKDRFGV